MKADAVFASIKSRFAGTKVARILITADEVAEWPRGLFDKLRVDKRLTPAEPAQTLECRGCERACFMPVNVMQAEGNRPARAFIACDKPENYGRVRVEFPRLHQWQLTRANFDKLARGWIVTHAKGKTPDLKKSKAPVTFRAALGRLLAEIEARAGKQSLPFDRNAMPGRKVDMQAAAEKFDPALEYMPRTFDDYLDGLCAFKRGARETDFYRKLFPEYFK